MAQKNMEATNRRQLLVGTSRKTVFRVLGSSAASQAAGALVNIFVLPKILHGIGVREYGEWATLAAVVAIGQLVQTGTNTEIARRVAVAQGQGDVAAVRQAVRQGTTVMAALALVVVVVTVAIARPLVDLIFTTVPAAQRGELTWLLSGAALVLALGLIGNAYFSVLTGLQRSDYSSWSSVISFLMSGVTTVVAVEAGMGLWALLLAAIVQLLVSWVGPAIGVRRLAPELGVRPARISWPVIVGFIGMPAMLVAASASDLFDSQVDKLVLAHAVGPKASAMFQIGVGFEQMMRTVALVPLAAMLAGTAELYRTNPAKLRRLEALSGSSTQALAALGAGGIVLFATPFVHVWLGSGYGAAALSAQVLSIAALFNMWSAPWTYYAMGRRLYHYTLIAATVTMVVNFLATVLLTSTIGLDGALIGSVAGSAAGTAAGRLILQRWEARAWLWPALRATGAVAVVAVPMFLFGPTPPASWLGLLGWATAYLAVCGALLLATGSLPVSLRMRKGALPSLEYTAPGLPLQLSDGVGPVGPQELPGTPEQVELLP